MTKYSARIFEAFSTYGYWNDGQPYFEIIFLRNDIKIPLADLKKHGTRTVCKNIEPKLDEPFDDFSFKSLRKALLIFMEDMRFYKKNGKTIGQFKNEETLKMMETKEFAIVMKEMMSGFSLTEEDKKSIDDHFDKMNKRLGR